MELMGSATWPEGWDHDLGGVFSGRALHVDFADCKTSLSHHGRQISESESEAQGTATGESQQRDSEERATGLSRQAGAEKEVDDAARQQPWFVREFRPAQLGQGRLGGLRQSSRGDERHGRDARRASDWAGANQLRA